MPEYSSLLYSALLPSLGEARFAYRDPSALSPEIAIFPTSQDTCLLTVGLADQAGVGVELAMTLPGHWSLDCLALPECILRGDASIIIASAVPL